MSDRIESWQDYVVKEKGMLPNSVRLYRRTLDVLEAEVGDITELDSETIRGWLHRKGGSPSSFSNRLSALRSFYRWQQRTKLRPDDPTVDIDTPKQRKSLPKPVEDLEAALALLDASDVRANAKGNLPRRVGETRDMAVFLCETGLRIHEAVALECPVPAPTTLRVKGKGAKDALIPLTDKAREAWDRLGKWPIGIRATQRRFERADFSPHQCRHWRGTSMAEAGADLGDIQHMLRHSSPQTTLGYAAWSVDRVRDALRKVG